MVLQDDYLACGPSEFNPSSCVICLKKIKDASLVCPQCNVPICDLEVSWLGISAWNLEYKPLSTRNSTNLLHKSWECDFISNTLVLMYVTPAISLKITPNLAIGTHDIQIMLKRNVIVFSTHTHPFRDAFYLVRPHQPFWLNQPWLLPYSTYLYMRHVRFEKKKSMSLLFTIFMICIC